MTGSWSCWVVVATGCVAGAGVARADYGVTVLSGGLSQLTLAPGQGANLDVMMLSPVGDRHDSAIIDLEWSSSGLMMESLAWAAPYQNGTFTDDSEPGSGDLPALIEEGSVSGPGYPAGMIEIELSNFLMTGTFGNGRIATVHVGVPVDYQGPGQVTVHVTPVAVALGFTLIPSSGGTDFVLTILPAPGAGVLGVVGLAWASRRRRGSSAVC